MMFSKTILEMNDALWSSRVIFTFGHSTDEWTLAILRTTMGPKSLWICKLWIQIWPNNYFSPIMRTIGHRHHHVPSKVSGSQICRGLMTNWTTFLGCPVALPYGEVRLKMNSVPRFWKLDYFNNSFETTFLYWAFGAILPDSEMTNQNDAGIRGKSSKV